MPSNVQLHTGLFLLSMVLGALWSCEATAPLGDIVGTSNPDNGQSVNQGTDGAGAGEDVGSDSSQILPDVNDEPSSCDGPSPEGCANLGCDAGFVCDLEAGCAPSYCSCDAEKSLWLCTSDCAGGVCVPEGGTPADVASSEVDAQAGTCSEPNPVGCVETGCPAGRKCDLNVGCAPSWCECDASTDIWSCTEDCGGGTCVPKDALECLAPDPTGCIKSGCAEGQVCDLQAGCAPSECWCDGTTGAWGCTTDCGGGVCVDPDATKKCLKDNPVGCVVAGCPKDFVCDPNLGCAPSTCDCDPQTGEWICTGDCNGGTCKPANALEAGCAGPNPAGCKITGCLPGLVCDTTVGCNPSSCICDKNSGQWQCTEDCGGGTCVEPEPVVCEPGMVAVDGKCMPCDEAADMTSGQNMMALDKYGICTKDAECIAKVFPSSCGESCPVAVNEQWAALYEKFVENTANQYCVGFVESCQPEPPICSGGDAFCSDNLCALKEE